jgi:DNA-binding response OmpR family regulator
MKVLIAEDDAVTRKIIGASLAGFGYEVVEAADGSQAWESFDRDPVRLVICDWNMPGLNGVELCRRIRERPMTEYAYVILATAERTDKRSYLSAMDHGVDDFMLKPLDPEQIRIRLKVAQRILSLGARVGELEKIITMCSYCRRIRSHADVYTKLEAYLQRHTKTMVSHGICPECVASQFPDLPKEAA